MAEIDGRDALNKPPQLLNKLNAYNKIWPEWEEHEIPAYQALQMDAHWQKSGWVYE